MSRVEVRGEGGGSTGASRTTTAATTGCGRGWRLDGSNGQRLGHELVGGVEGVVERIDVGLDERGGLLGFDRGSRGGASRSAQARAPLKNRLVLRLGSAWAST
jgi:hypothetical protein